MPDRLRPCFLKIDFLTPFNNWNAAFENSDISYSKKPRLSGHTGAPFAPGSYLEWELAPPIWSPSFFQLLWTSSLESALGDTQPPPYVHPVRPTFECQHAVLEEGTSYTAFPTEMSSFNY